MGKSIFHVVVENTPRTVVTKNSIVLCSLCFMHSMIYLSTLENIST